MGSNRTITAMLGIFPVWAIGLAFLWNREEPHKFNTVVVFLVVFILGYLIIRKAARAGIVKSQGQWMLVLMLKLSLTLLLTFIWIEAWGPGQHRFEWGYDPRAWDLYGTWVAEDGFLESLPHFGRGTVQGVVIYIGAIYRLFGVSTLYVHLFNGLLSLVTFLSLVGILTDLTKDARPWQLLRYGLLFPEIAFHDAEPSKEPLSLAFFCFALFLSVRLLKGKLRPLQYFYLLLTMVCLWAVRPPMLIALAALVIFYVLYNRKVGRGLMVLGWGTLLTLVLLNLPGGLFTRGGYRAEEHMERYLSWEVRTRSVDEAIAAGTTSDDPLKQKVNRLLLVTGPLDVLLVGPIRTAVLLVAPFPKVIILPEHLALEVGTAPQWFSNYNKLTALTVLFLLPFLCAAVLQKRCRASPVYSYIVLSFVLVLFMAANWIALMHTRSRTMADPLLLATALIGYRYGRASVFALPCLAFVVLGVGFYYWVWAG